MLREAIASVLDQSYSELEIWVSDDDSTDDTEAVVASITDERVHYVRQRKHSGLHANFNHCLTLGCAPLLVILGDDDLMRRDNIEHKVALLDSHPEVGIVHSAISWIDAAGNTLAVYVAPHGFGVKQRPGDRRRPESGYQLPEREFLDLAMRSMSPIDLSAGMFRRSLVGSLSFDEADETSCDVSFWLEVARGTQIAYLAEPLTARRVHGSELVRSGMSSVAKSGYRVGWEQIHLQREVKLRFLARAALDPAVRMGLEKTAKRFSSELVLYTLVRCVPRWRTPADVARDLSAARRIDPAFVLVYPRSLVDLLTRRFRHAIERRSRLNALE